MSPRAAYRLETIGFTAVYDYTGGKADWLGAGLPPKARMLHSPTRGLGAHRCPHLRTSILVTDPEGRILGVLHRNDADAALRRPERGERATE